MGVTAVVLVTVLGREYHGVTTHLVWDVNIEGTQVQGVSPWHHHVALVIPAIALVFIASDGPVLRRFGQFELVELGSEMITRGLDHPRLFGNLVALVLE